MKPTILAAGAGLKLGPLDYPVDKDLIPVGRLAMHCDISSSTSALELRKEIKF
jgi:hypothetical protein